MFFFFNDTASTEIYTLSLHDALPIYTCVGHMCPQIVFTGHTNVSTGHMCPAHVSDTCMLKMFSQDTQMFPLDTCVGHMYPTHVSDTCVLMSSGLNIEAGPPHFHNISAVK